LVTTSSNVSSVSATVLIFAPSAVWGISAY
jgi:hypothetical protein